MSRYIHILNAIKSNVTRFPLTPSQVACRTRIQERLAYPGVVNLYGLAGVGKTVLGWAMAAEGEVAYVAHLRRWEQTGAQRDCPVFVDNAAGDRTSFRRLLAAMESASLERVVIVTRTPIDDYVFRAELVLTGGDVCTARHNLAELRYHSADIEYSNLWHLLLHLAREIRWA